MGDLSALFLEYARLDRRRTDEGLTVPELERWSQLKRRLTLHFSPGLDPREVDRRRSVRVPTLLCVTYEANDGFERSRITKLSRAGAFVQTPHPLSHGSPVRLRIRIEEDSSELEVEGEVITSQNGPTFGQGEIGMGIRFSEMDSETAKRLGDLYERVIRREFGRD